MADFQFYLNRQGVRGPQGYKGDKGDDGKTPVPRTGTNTPIETTVIFDTGDGNPYETPNLKYPIEDRGGNMVMLDRTNSTQYYGTPDQATGNSYGVVKLATSESVLDDPLDSDVVTYELFDENNQAIKAVTDGLAGDITQLNIDLGAEVTNRTNADTQLTNKINTDVGNEATARNNADIALNGRIDGLNSSKANKSDVYTKTQTDSLLSNKSNVGHTHNYNDLTNKPTIGNGTITITQGGVVKGSFTTNQLSNGTIDLDAGGGGGGGGTAYTAGNGINITNDVISVKVDDDSIYINQNGELVANLDDITDALEAILGGDASIFDDYYTKTQSDSRYVQGSALSQVAISGSYNDLTNKPTIPSAQIQSDWGQTTTSALDYIKNKPTNLVTTDNAQTITGRKTFIGPAAIYFKQSTSTDKLGFTLYDSSNSELAGFQYRPQTIDTTNLLNINTSYINDTLLGFRYWSNGGSNPTVNVIAPKPLTGGNYYIPVNITDGTNTVTANSSGTVDISTLLSGGSTPSNMVTTDTQQIITGRKDMAIINIQPSGSTGYLNYITPMSSGRIAISKSTSYDTASYAPGVLLEYTGGSSITSVANGGNGSYINLCTEYGNNTAEIRFCNGLKAGQVGSNHASIGKYGNYTYIRNNNSTDKKVYKITGSPSSTSSYTNFFLESDMLDGTYLKWDSSTGKITVDIQAIKDAINAL